GRLGRRDQDPGVKRLREKPEARSQKPEGGPTRPRAFSFWLLASGYWLLVFRVYHGERESRKRVAPVHGDRRPQLPDRDQGGRGRENSRPKHRALCPLKSRTNRERPWPRT